MDHSSKTGKYGEYLHGDLLASKYHRILDYCCIFEDFLGAIFKDFCTDLDAYVHCMFTECISVIYCKFYGMRQKKVFNIFTELYF